MGSVCLGDLVNLNTSINKGAVWMYNTFTVIANRLGCTNGMTMKCCNKIEYKLRSKVGSVLNAMINGTSVIWNAEWNGYLNGSLQ